MLELDSPDWANYTHAYGDASDLPSVLAKLRAAASASEWEEIEAELMNVIMHQGDVYTATYAISPHLLQYATELGPGKQSDALLFNIAYASRGGAGPDVPEKLEDAWEDAQDEARELILERLRESEASEEYAAYLIAGLLYLSGEWSAGAVVNDWCWGQSMVARCAACKTEVEVFWHEGSPKRVMPGHRFEDVVIRPASEDVIAVDEDFEFDEEQLRQQIISLAAASRHPSVERQLRSLFGSIPCDKCGSSLPLSPKD
jgi:hypothetical protein